MMLYRQARNQTMLRHVVHAAILLGLAQLSNHVQASSLETCLDGPKLRMIQPLDFGDLAMAKKMPGFVTVTSAFNQSLSPTLTALRPPQPGELSLCGTPQQEIDIVIAQASLPLRGSSGPPLANTVKDFTIAGEGISLIRISAGRWRGTIGDSGRATIRIGATLDLVANGAYGHSYGEIDIEVVGR